jgi:predicted PurR-regulated permease PerM
VRRPRTAYLISFAANGAVMDRERIARIFFFGFLAVIAYELYRLLSPFLVPIAWAMLLAFIAHPALLQLLRFVRNRAAAAFILTAALALAIAVPTVLLSTVLASEAKAVPLERYFGHGALSNPGALRFGFITSLETWMVRHGFPIIDVDKWLQVGTAYLVNFFGSNAATVARNLLTFVIDLGIMLFTFFYLLRDGEEYYEFVRSLTPLPEEDKTTVFDTLSSMLSSTVRGLLLTSILEGLLLGFGYLVADVPFWALLAALSAAAGLLPIGGTAFIWVPAAVYLWVVAGWGWCVGLLVWGTLTVAVVDNFIKPHAIGQGSGLPTIALFFGITGGLEVYGLLGLFAGPAVLAIFVALVQVYRRTYMTRPPTMLG